MACMIEKEKMKLSICFAVSLLIVGTKGCLTRRKRPENSLVSCVVDRESDRYTHCRYVCRQGYHFKELVEEKVQLCSNGTWIPEDIGDCIAQSNKETFIKNQCSIKPKHPKNSHSSCSFRRNSTEYAECAYFCVRGFYFDGSVVHRQQLCVNGTWIPEEVGNCISQAGDEHSCLLRPKKPKNSLSTCRFDKNLEGYTRCTYTCKNGYYFHGEVNEKTHYCVNGRWEPDKLGDCVDETQRYSPAAGACFVKPAKIPKKSFEWCNYDTNLGVYTECAYACTTGYHFDGMVSEKTRQCVDGQWMPEKLEDCKNQRKRYAVGVGPCSSIPYFPRNSFVSCTLERDSTTVKRNCTYVCREGYYFSDTKGIKMQQCENDTWNPTSFEDCINPSHNPDSVERACTSAPAKRPRNAVIYFNYNGAVGGYTDSKYICFVGHSFHGRVNEKTQICADGTWIPEKVGDCF